MFKSRLPLMNRAMDAYSLRQQTTAKNIANATSPRYRPERVKFEELFHDQEVVIKGSTTEGSDVGSSAANIPIGKLAGDDVEGEKENRAIPEAEVYFEGETHVNVDKEMNEMAQNQIRYRFASMATKKHFNGMLSSIRGSSVG